MNVVHKSSAHVCIIAHLFVYFNSFTPIFFGIFVSGLVKLVRICPVFIYSEPEQFEAKSGPALCRAEDRLARDSLRGLCARLPVKRGPDAMPFVKGLLFCQSVVTAEGPYGFFQAAVQTAPATIRDRFRNTAVKRFGNTARDAGDGVTVPADRDCQPHGTFVVVRFQKCADGRRHRIPCARIELVVPAG